MIINSSGIIKGVLTGLVRASNGEALTSPSDFEILDNSWIEASILNSHAYEIQLEGTSAFDYEVGDMIEVRQAIGENYPIIARIISIANSGASLLLEDKLRDAEGEEITSGSLQVRSLEQRTELKDIDEGYYIIKPSNIKLVVRDNYIQPEINLSDLFARYPDARNLSRADLKIIEQTALKDIYSNLSDLENYFDIVDEVKMERLLLFKTICIVHQRTNADKENSYCKMYEKEIMKYYPKEIYEVDESGEIISEAPIKIYSFGERSL